MTHIPNSYQKPNVYVDVYMQYLTPVEYMVLDFAIRHIYGWQDKLLVRQGHISLSVFEDGFMASSGHHYGGTSLTRAAIMKALDGLKTYRLLVPVGKPDNRGQLWTIGEEVDIDGLKARAEQQRDRNRKRTKAAITAKGGTSDEPLRWYVGRTGGGTSDEPAGGSSDEPIQTHSTNTITKTTDSAASDEATGTASEEHITCERCGSADKLLHTDGNAYLCTSCNKQSKAERKAYRDSLFDAIAQQVFGFRANGKSLSQIVKDNKAGGRIAKLVTYMESQDATPDKLTAFVRWYGMQAKGASIPRDVAKFAEWWTQYTLNSSGSSAPQYVTAPEDWTP